MKRFLRPKMIVVCIALVGAVLRLGLLGSIPVSLYVDEAAIGLDAKVVAQTGKDMHGNSMFQAIYPSYGDYKLPVYIFAASAAVKVFGANEFAVRLPSALAGIATIVLIYGICLALFEKEKPMVRQAIALWSAALVAIMPWSLVFSRTGFEGHLGQALVLCSLLFALHVKRGWKYVIASAILGALAVYTYYSVRFVFPVVFLGALAIQTSKKTWRNIAGFATLGLLVWGALLIPMTKSPLYEASQKFRLSARSVLQQQDSYVEYSNMLREQDNFNVFSRLVHHRLFYLAKALARNYAENLSLSFVFLNGDPNLRHGTGNTGLLLLAELPLFMVGLYALVRRHMKLFVFLLFWYLAALLPASVPNEIPHALRSLNALGILGLTMGLGAAEIWFWAKKNVIHRWMSMALVGAILLNFFAFAYDYLRLYPQRSAEAWFDGNKQIAELVEKNRKNYPKIVVAGDEKIFLWILFYGNYSAEQIQSLPSVNYRKLSVENVFFGKDTVKTAIAQKDAALVIGMSDELGNLQGEPILGAGGVSRYYDVELGAR